MRQEAVSVLLTTPDVQPASESASMNRIVLSVAAVGVLVVAGPALVGAAPASAKYRVGVGEQNSQMFDSPSWQSLKLKRVRYLVPWDYAKHAGQRDEVDHYMARARAAR